MDGPDHSCSLEPHEFKDLVDGIRQIELSLGSSLKKPSAIEIENSRGMKRGMVIVKSINIGEVLTKEHIGFKRPLQGVPINMLDQIIGKKVTRTLQIDDSIDYNCIEW